jgi:hypothetical protein
VSALYMKMDSKEEDFGVAKALEKIIYYSS